MSLDRILMALCAALLVAGAVGAATHSRPTRAPRVTAGTSPASTVGAAPSSARVPGSPGPTNASLADGLITPTDMGGYYRVVPSSATGFLDSAPCLAAIQASPAQSGRAVTALLGPDAHSVPMIVEAVASYPGEEAQPVFTAVGSALGSCSSFSFEFGATPVSGRLQSGYIPPVGDADRVWSVPFVYGGADFELQLALVLDNQEVLTLGWIDTVPGSDPIMGGFSSTVSLAIGKLA